MRKLHLIFVYFRNEKLKIICGKIESSTLAVFAAETTKLIKRFHTF